jgi:hypothetical protein
MCHCKVWQQNRGFDPEDKGGIGVLQQGHRGEGLQVLEVQDLGCCYVSATSCFTEGHTPPYLLLKLTDVLTDVITDVLTDV